MALVTAEDRVRGQGRPAGPAARPRAQEGRLPVLPALFLLALIVPIYFSLGSFRLSPYRVILIIALFPSLVRWLGGQAGPIRAPDVLVVLAFLWAALTYLIVHGIERGYQPAGILFIEAAGSYLLARTMIRNVEQFVAMVRLLFLIVLALLPFAIIEARTGQPPIMQITRMFAPTFTIISQETRLGLERAQVVFEHSILYGAFVSSAMGLTIYVLALGRGFFRRVLDGGLVFLTAFLSISGGALLALVFQLGMRGWDFATRRIPRRWTILGLGVLALYILIDLGSNRTPFHVFVSYATFSPGSSYNRILIWNYGTDEVLRHPIFGIGLGDWLRADWMGSSVDNFWLYHAMRHGLPGIILFGASFILLLRRAGWLDLRDPVLIACRAGWLTSLGGMAFAGFTVHYWNALFVWFMFLMGIGMWLFDAPQGPGSEPGADAEETEARAPPPRRSVLSDAVRPVRGADTPPEPPPGPARPPGGRSVLS